MKIESDGNTVEISRIDSERVAIELVSPEVKTQLFINAQWLLSAITDLGFELK